MNVKETAAVDSVLDLDMAARAAWLHFVGGLTQSEVAKRLNVPVTRAHRQIARAQKLGLVRVSVDLQPSDCVALETRLMEAYGLKMCRVAMSVPEEGPLPLRTLSVTGGEWLSNTVSSGAHSVIGVSHGRTIAASVEAMARCAAKDVRIVSMLGGLTRSFAANPYDVIHGLARKTGAEAYLMPVPLFVDKPEDKAVLNAQSGMTGTIRLMREATIAFVGIGEVKTGHAASLRSIAGSELTTWLQEHGAQAEVLGQFIDESGSIMETPLNDRVMALELEALRDKEVVAIAGGDDKRDAIRAVLRSKLLSGLLLDEATARSLVHELDATEAP